MTNRFDLANAIRALAMDAVQKANSGHPGMPMGMADIAEVLWNDFLAHNPADPSWVNRDRFVVSNGHGSMLLYALLHLTGYDLPMEELKNFRQLHSKTPGHPEYGYTPGVETTTGPLGQGIGMAVGMAMAEAVLASRFNREGLPLVDHYTYVFNGDGCLMEGISHEACSLAGTLGLGKLVMFYDDNNISIDGEVEGWFRDDTPARFEAYGWQVIRNVNGHDPHEIKLALETAKKSKDKPTLICCKTVIGFGAPTLAGKEKCHGAPLGAAEIAGAREKLGWAHAPFEIPQAVYDGWDAKTKGATKQQAWNKTFDEYAKQFPQDAAEFVRRSKGELPADWAAFSEALVAEHAAADKPNATRKSSKAVIEALAAKLPELFGGSADLGESNGTDFKGHLSLRHGKLSGNYVNWGVREFGMSAAMNGITLHGGLRPFGGTFLVFSDYARNAVRLSALMKLPTIYVYTHDSIALGEDGPTHQPVEHIASLRLIPNLQLWRPADAFETAVAWKAAIERKDGPSLLVLTRQNLAPQVHAADHAALAARGGYVLWQPQGKPQALILATGSEVEMAVNAARKLGEEGKAVQVVSLPCVERFWQQDAAYRESVLPQGIKRLAVEAGVTAVWRGMADEVIGIDTFGESAPYAALMQHFGFTVENIASRMRTLMA